MTLIAAITGGASGIGRGTAQRLLDDGWTVVALDRSEAGLARLAEDFFTTWGEAAGERWPKRLAGALVDALANFASLSFSAHKPG